MTSPEPSIQTVFLERIRERIPANVSFADELADILNISRDSAYRRIRGETILSLDEAKTLHNRFGISLDILFSNSSEMVTFHRRVVNYKDYTMEKWLNSILKNLIFLGQFEPNEMIFSARDIPAFHYFRNEALAEFKLFFWRKSLIGDPAYEKKNIGPGAVPQEMLRLADRIWTTYASLNSTEIWNEQVVYETLKQIEFYHECGFFTRPAHAQELCDQLLKVLQQVQEEAALGEKPGGGGYNLYNNEILIADNTVFARMGTRRCVYVNQNALNLYLTFQEPFCEQTETYLQNLLRQSNLISKTGERGRNKFFMSLVSKVEAFREGLK